MKCKHCKKKIRAILRINKINLQEAIPNYDQPRYYMSWTKPLNITGMLKEETIISPLVNPSSRQLVFERTEPRPDYEDDWYYDLVDIV